MVSSACPTGVTLFISFISNLWKESPMAALWNHPRKSCNSAPKLSEVIFLRCRLKLPIKATRSKTWLCAPSFEDNSEELFRAQFVPVSEFSNSSEGVKIFKHASFYLLLNTRTVQIHLYSISGGFLSHTQQLRSGGLDDVSNDVTLSRTISQALMTSPCT